MTCAHRRLTGYRFRGHILSPNDSIQEHLSDLVQADPTPEPEWRPEA